MNDASKEKAKRDGRIAHLTGTRGQLLATSELLKRGIEVFVPIMDVNGCDLGQWRICFQTSSSSDC